MKTRREVIQGLIVSVGGAALLSRCGGVATVLPSTAAAGNNRFYSEPEMRLVTRVSDLLIPRTETPGALDVNVPGFLDGLMTEWASADTQREHRASLAQLHVELDRLAGGAFVSTTERQAEAALATFDQEVYSGAREDSGYRNLKSLIAQSYFATEAGALQEQGWVAVPGRWDPCVER